MKIIFPGHIYDLDNIDGNGTQRLHFVYRRNDAGELLPIEAHREGIQTQELLRVAIDRTLYLNAEQAWHENVDIVNHLRDALRLYDLRAAHSSLNKLGMPELASHCLICGHIFCLGH